MHSQFNHVYMEDDFTHHDDALTCVSGGANAVQIEVRALWGQH